MSSKEVDEQMLNIQAKNTSYFVEWIPTNMKSSICDARSRGLKMASKFIGNTTAFRELFTCVDNQFTKMCTRRAFIHWYVNEGLETVEFNEARSNMTDLIQEDEMYETAGVDEVGEGEEDEYEGAKGIKRLVHLVLVELDSQS
jgi:tubulin beta